MYNFNLKTFSYSIPCMKIIPLDITHERRFISFCAIYYNVRILRSRWPGVLFCIIIPTTVTTQQKGEIFQPSFLSANQQQQKIHFYYFKTIRGSFAILVVAMTFIKCSISFEISLIANKNLLLRTIMKFSREIVIFYDFDFVIKIKIKKNVTRFFKARRNIKFYAFFKFLALSSHFIIFCDLSLQKNLWKSEKVPSVQNILTMSLIHRLHCLQNK